MITTSEFVLPDVFFSTIPLLIIIGPGTTDDSFALTATFITAGNVLVAAAIVCGTVINTLFVNVFVNPASVITVVTKFVTNGSLFVYAVLTYVRLALELSYISSVNKIVPALSCMESIIKLFVQTHAVSFVVNVFVITSSLRVLSCCMLVNVWRAAFTLYRDRY